MRGRLHLLPALILMIGALLFSLTDPGEVPVPLPGGAGPLPVPLTGLLFIPLSIGFLLGLFASWADGAQCRRRASELLRDNRALEEELTNLRNLPLDDTLHS
ncbi:MAG: LapA family protein [Magnetococcales bacterium]|nr:LapA family protein [Magnetococcales bacterium]